MKFTKSGEFTNARKRVENDFRPRDDDGLMLLENFQKEGTLRDLRDLSVLAPPEIPKRFHNFSIFD